MRTYYVGMDVHSASIVIVVLNGAGKVVETTVIKTSASAVRSYLQRFKGRVLVTFEEGAQAQWLYDLVQPLVTEVIVCDPRQNKLLLVGDKSDRIDAEKLAELLRNGSLVAVDHRDYGMRMLKELVRNYECLVQDTTRLMSRLKAIFRSRAIACKGHAVYRQDRREQWLKQLPEPGLRLRARSLYEQLAVLNPLRQEAKLLMLREARRQPAYKWLLSVPRLGPVSVSQLLAIVGTPHRFRSKRQFWPYVGLAVMTRSTGDHEVVNGVLQRRRKPVATRGLNRNHNRRLKKVFKTAATSAAHSGPFAAAYEQRLKRGLDPALARLTLARQIAAITLRVWKNEERFTEQKLKPLQA
jgi:transposase